MTNEVVADYRAVTTLAHLAKEIVTMRKFFLSATGRQRLKVIHHTIGAIWLGCGVAIIVLRLAWSPSGESDPRALNLAVGLLNDWIIIPSALGSLLTGLLASWLTPWGFFKNRWVTVKLIVTVAIVIASPVFTSGWEREMEAISRVEGSLSLQNGIYLQDELLVNASGGGKVAAISALTVISILKPWRRRG